MSESRDLAKVHRAAQWMANQIKTGGVLYQDWAAREIRGLFGEGVTYTNANGNLAIDRRVLREFRKLTDESVVWERPYKQWRRRRKGDRPRKRQVE